MRREEKAGNVDSECRQSREISQCCRRAGASKVVPVVKNPPANAGDMGSVPCQEDPLEKERTTQSSILAWEIPRTEEPGGLQESETT